MEAERLPTEGNTLNPVRKSDGYYYMVLRTARKQTT